MRPKERWCAQCAVPNVHCGEIHYSRHTFKEHQMIWTIALVLIVLWALGLVGGYAAGGLIHVLLVIALIVIATRFFTGRRVV
jgi:predicted nucleic acid-binding Zn ribbon protein